MKLRLAFSLSWCLVAVFRLSAAVNGFWFGGSSSDLLWTTSSNWSTDEKTAVASGYPGDGTWDAGLLQFREPGFAGGTVQVPAGGVTVSRLVIGYGKSNTPQVTFAGGKLTLSNTGGDTFRNDTALPTVFTCPVHFSGTTPTVNSGVVFEGGLTVNPDGSTFTVNFQDTYSRLRDVVFAGAGTVFALTNTSDGATFAIHNGAQLRVLDGATVNASIMNMQRNGTTLAVTGATVRARNLYLQRTDDYSYAGPAARVTLGPAGELSVTERLTQSMGEFVAEGTSESPATATVGSTFHVNSGTWARFEHAVAQVGTLEVLGRLSILDGAAVTATQDANTSINAGGRLEIVGSDAPPQPTVNLYSVNLYGGTVDVERATLAFRRGSLEDCRLEAGSPASLLRIGTNGVVELKGIRLNDGELRIVNGGLLHLLEGGSENNVSFDKGRLIVADGGRFKQEGITYADMQTTGGGEIVVENGGVYEGETIACRCAPNRVTVERGGRMTLTGNMIVTDTGAATTNAELVVRGDLTVFRLQPRGKGAIVTVDGGHLYADSASWGLTVTADKSVPKFTVTNNGTLAAAGMNGTLAAGSVSVSAGGYFAVSNTFTCTDGATFNVGLSEANRAQAGLHFNSLSCTGRMRLAVTGPAATDLPECTAYYILSVADASADPANLDVTYNGATVATDGSTTLTLVRTGGRLALFRFGAESGNAAKVLHGGTETEYASFDAAFAALQDGDTLTLLRNCVVMNGVALPANAHVTLNGAGHSVYALTDTAAFITVGATSGLALKDIGVTVFGSTAAVSSAADVAVGGAVNIVGNAQNIVLSGTAKLVLSANLTGRVGVTSGTGNTVFGQTAGFAGAENIVNETAAYVKYGDVAQRLEDGSLAWTGPETVLVWTAPAGSEANVAWGAVANSYTTWFTKPGGTEKIAWLNGAKAVFGKAGTCTGIRIASSDVIVNEIRIEGETAPLSFTAGGRTDSIMFCGDNAGIARIVTPQDVSITNSYTIKNATAGYPEATKLVLKKSGSATGTPMVRIPLRNSSDVFYYGLPIELDGAALALDHDAATALGGSGTYAFAPAGVSGTGELCLLSRNTTTNATAVTMGNDGTPQFTHVGRTVVDGPIKAEFVTSNALSAASSLVVTNGALVVARYPLGGIGSTQPITVASNATLEVQYVNEINYVRSTLGCDRTLTVDGGRVLLPSGPNGHTQNDVPRHTWLLNGALIDSPYRMAFPDVNDYDQTIYSRGDSARTNVVTASLAARSGARGTSYFDVEAPLLLSGGLVGSYPYVKSGTGTLILAGHDAQDPGGATGTFTVSAGTLELVDAQVLSNATLVVASGTTLRPATGTVNIGALTLGADTVLDAAHQPIALRVADAVSVDPSARAVGPNGEKFKIFVGRMGGGYLVTVGKGGSILIVK